MLELKRIKIQKNEDSSLGCTVLPRKLLQQEHVSSSFRPTHKSYHIRISTAHIFVSLSEKFKDAEQRKYIFEQRQYNFLLCNLRVLHFFSLTNFLGQDFQHCVEQNWKLRKYSSQCEWWRSRSWTLLKRSPWIADAFFHFFFWIHLLFIACVVFS